MKIDKTKLYALYMDKVDKISEAGDWKKPFGPKEIVDIIANILEKNPDLMEERLKKRSLDVVIYDEGECIGSFFIDKDVTSMHDLRVTNHLLEQTRKTIYSRFENEKWYKKFKLSIVKD